MIPSPQNCGCLCAWTSALAARTRSYWPVCSAAQSLVFWVVPSVLVLQVVLNVVLDVVVSQIVLDVVPQADPSVVVPTTERCGVWQRWAAQ